MYTISQEASSILSSFTKNAFWVFKNMYLKVPNNFRKPDLKQWDPLNIFLWKLKIFKPLKHLLKGEAWLLVLWIYHNNNEMLLQMYLGFSFFDNIDSI